jgi:alpha-1,3-glucosyltransferase
MGAVRARAISLARAHLPLVLLAAALKSLLAFGYRSTDFEVHRNWLAVTHAFPPWRWYTDAGPSEWTLDYPPLFAAAEWGLGLLAPLVGVPEALGLSADPVATKGVVLFQRVSVHVADLLLLVGACAYVAAATPTPTPTPTPQSESPPPRWRALLVLLLLNPGLVLLDHVHFQYNGALLGLLLLSLALLRTGRHDSLGAATFTALLLSKHLFLVLAPAVGVYLYSRACKAEGSAAAYFPSVRRLLGLAGPALLVAATVLAPVLLPVINDSDFGSFGGVDLVWARTLALLGRLFPFGRGLTHSYWAPNAWALYMGADRALHAACRVASSRAPASIAAFLTCGGGAAASLGATPTASSSPTGLSTNALLLLPQPSPPLSAALVLLAMAPTLLALWRAPRPAALARACALCWFAAFAFGWHVHEKATLYGLVPLWMAAGEGEGEGEGDAVADGEVEGEKVSSAAMTRPAPARRARAGSRGAEKETAAARRREAPGKGGAGAGTTSPGLLRTAWLLSLPAHVCLLPLIFTPLETPAVLVLVTGYAWWSWGVLEEASRAEGRVWPPLRRGEVALCLALAAATLFSSCGLHTILVPRLPFLHLMVMSVVCAGGLVAAAVL